MQMFNEMNALQEDEHLVFGFIRESESSLPSTTYYHIVKPIIMLTVKYFHDDPKMEVEKMNELKDKIHGLWDILDMDANGDVDREEFDVGLQTANIQLGHSQIHQLFDFIDSDRQTGYIDRQQFTLFLMTTWQNNNLQKLQNVFVHKIKMSKIQSMELLIEIEKLKNQVDDIKYESIDEIKSIDNDDNDTNTMQVMESMHIAMESLVNEEIAKAQRLDELYEELEEKRKDSDFGRIDNCAQWNKYEVVSFLEE
eukprot:5985_1